VNVDHQLERIRRGVVEIITEDALREKLSRGTSLRIKAGFDPTAPDLHLGHTVLLRKLRQFQNLGHTVIFLIGDATALVGDPSGQSKLRKMMTWNEVERHAHTYVDQVRQILKVDEPSAFQLARNSRWFVGADRDRGGPSPFTFETLLELLSRYTVARLIERDDFQKRLKGGQELSMLELFYPLMQGYDSVQLKADVELGGTDQTFNLLVGRDLQRAYGQEPQVVITLPLLEGTDGVQKMSKSLGNHIGIAEPPGEQFGKLMSIPDTLIVKYFTLLTDVPTVEITAMERQLTERSVNPRDLKARLAEDIVRLYHGADAARAAWEEFFKVFSRREPPTAAPSVTVPDNGSGRVDLVALLVREGLATSKNDARRLLHQGAVSVNGTVVKTPALPLAEATGLLQVGPRHFRQLVAGST
jgi:tyrosyl-tRNA synthetase